MPFITLADLHIELSVCLWNKFYLIVVNVLFCFVSMYYWACKCVVESLAWVFIRVGLSAILLTVSLFGLGLRVRLAL